MSSLSSHAMNGADDSRIPLLRVFGRPSGLWCRTLTRRSSCAYVWATRGVLSVDPSSMMTSSRSRSVCPSTDSIAAARWATPSRTGMITLTRGVRRGGSNKLAGPSSWNRQALVYSAGRRLLALARAPPDRARPTSLNVEVVLHAASSDPTGSPLVSVVICTFRRPDLLARCLARLAVSLPADGVEVIVVDNDAAGSAEATVQRMTQRLPGLRYVLEPELGLSFARNRGLRTARGGFVAYIDDDVLISDSWFTALRERIQQSAGEVIGGPYYPCFIDRSPAWFRDDYLSNSMGERGRVLSPGETLSGANLAVRRTLALCVGGFAEDYGLKGAQIGLGEETEFQMRLREKQPGARVFYDPACSVLHLTPPAYTTFPWYAKRLFTAGRQHYRLTYLSRPGGLRSFSLLLKGSSAVCLMAIVPLMAMVRSRNRYPTVENLLWEVALPKVVHLGIVYEFAQRYTKRLEGRA